MAYTHRRTGSARSVGKRRIIKLYETKQSNVAIAARSAAGARMDAQLAGLEVTGAFFSGTPTTIVDRRKGDLAAQGKAVTAGGQQPPAAQTTTITPVAGLPVTGDAGGTQTASLDLDFHGSVKAGTFTVVYNIGAADAQVTAAVLATDTPSQAAGKVAAAIDGVTGLGATKTGSTITVTPTDGTVLSKLTASFA
jgi:hypothetical protein